MFNGLIKKISKISETYGDLLSLQEFCWQEDEIIVSSPELPIIDNWKIRGLYEKGYLMFNKIEKNGETPIYRLEEDSNKTKVLNFVAPIYFGNGEWRKKRDYNHNSTN